jgi:hypothetical protein
MYLYEGIWMKAIYEDLEKYDRQTPYIVRLVYDPYVLF